MESLVVIKIGGNIIDDESKLSSFLKDFAEIPGRKILVHGGGKLATRLAEQLGVEQQMIDGRRITDEHTLRIVTMVYAGYINKTIVATLQTFGCNALGLCGADGNSIQAHKRNHPTIDYGFAGDIDHVNVDLIKKWLDLGLTLVIAPVTHDKKGQLLNTNADTIAQEIARAISAEYDVNLIYSFEKKGVLLDATDESTVIPDIRPSDYEQLKAEKKIFAGMIPKIDNAFAALNSGVRQVTIGKAEDLQALINHQAGTRITNE
ncbi:MAG TPA: acetylglutamate kinase [Puia sp.]|nr:acetylglutamate kinase [Puia sp.]